MSVEYTRAIMSQWGNADDRSSTVVFVPIAWKLQNICATLSESPDVFGSSAPSLLTRYLELGQADRRDSPRPAGRGSSLRELPQTPPKFLFGRKLIRHQSTREVACFHETIAPKKSRTQRSRSVSWRLWNFFSCGAVALSGLRHWRGVLQLYRPFPKVPVSVLRCDRRARAVGPQSRSSVKARSMSARLSVTFLIGTRRTFANGECWRSVARHQRQTAFTHTLSLLDLAALGE